MIHVALLVRSRRLRDELRALVGASDRLQLATHNEAAVQPDFLSFAAIDAILCDGAQALLEPARRAHEAGVALIVLVDEGESVPSLSEPGAGVALLPTSASAEQIVAAIEAASLGLFVSHVHLLDEGEIPIAAIGDGESEPLTPRELEVLLALAAGLGNKSIATRLGISEHTAKFHVSQILAKLHVGSRAEAVSVGLRRGLLPL